jgi:hypothetical protein
MMPVTDQQDHSHIEIVHHSQRKHYLSRHEADAGKHFRPRIDLFPGADGEHHISEIQQVITYQQDPVDESCKFFISVQQVEYIHFTVPVKPQPHVNCYEVGDGEVDDVSECVHTTCFERWLITQR